ncbi:MAG TPA: hypothetical protein VF647_18940 [Longimicrobium sp.]|jgi:hypothetical protein
MTTESTTADIPFESLPLTGDAGDAFVAIAALLEAEYLDVGRETDFAGQAFALASRLVARVRRVEGAPTDAELRMAALEMSEAAHAAADRGGVELPESLEQLTEDQILDAERLIQEAALEDHTHDAYLALEGDTETILLVASPVSTAAAHVALIEVLFDRVEGSIQGDPLAEVERAAALWWFRRWRPAKPVVDDEFPAGVREQEWSLVDHASLATGLSPMAEMVQDEEGFATIPPRQRLMARNLLQSVTGIWHVRERTGDEVVFVSVVDGGESTVIERGTEEEAAYGPGAVVIGRLIPFTDGTWLRSPGSITVPVPPAEWTRALAEAVKESAELEVPRAIFLEAVLTRTMTREQVPRPVPPARSATEARELLARLNTIFLEAGIAQVVDPATLPPELREQMPTEFVYQALDVILADWVEALGNMARKGTGGGKSKANRRKRR